MRWVLVLAAVAGKLAAQGCGLSVSPAYYDGTNGSSVVPAAGGTFTVNVDSPGFCPSWSVAVPGGPTWLTLNQTSGQGPGTFTFTVAANTANSGRGTAVITVTGGWKIPVAQAGAVCSLTLGAASGNVAVGAGPGTFAFQTGCDWNALSGSSWISFPPPSTTTSTTPVSYATGTGSASVSYNVGANSCVAGRIGTISVGAGATNRNNNNNPVVTYTVNQAGSADNLTVSPQNAAYDVTGGTGRITVNTGVGCAWNYYVDQTWIQITNGGGGSGPSGITYNVPQNTGGARTGHITVGAQTFTISQGGVSVPVPQLTALESAASYAQGAIAPGEVVALFGTLMGPAKGVAAQLAATDKFFPNTLAGVQVMFDGKYAAIPYYVSATQINAIVPYEIAEQTTTQITVQYGGGTSAALTAQVQAAAPGILTLDFSGAGQGAILNQDYAVNGTFSKAARGSAVMIYLIGAGATNPASGDGSVTAGLNALATQPVTVTIGGIPAQVLYAGGAPGAVAGLTQINAVVPANVQPGPNGLVSLSIQIGSWQTQAGVTMVVQ